MTSKPFINGDEFATKDARVNVCVRVPCSGGLLLTVCYMVLAVAQPNTGTLKQCM